jgi:hypothetical protein
MWLLSTGEFATILHAEPASTQLKVLKGAAQVAAARAPRQAKGRAAVKPSCLWCVRGVPCARLSGFLLRWSAGSFRALAGRGSGSLTCLSGLGACRDYITPVGTSSAQASAGATRTTAPAYIMSWR